MFCWLKKVNHYLNTDANQCGGKVRLMKSASLYSRNTSSIHVSGLSM